MRYSVVAICAVLSTCLVLAITRPADIKFQKDTLDLGANEACAFADINGDGRTDIVSGENWYEAPLWKQHRFRDLSFVNNFIDNFSDLPVDVNGDGRVDVVSCSLFNHVLAWWENPGGDAPWTRHVIDGEHGSEFAFLVDLDNDGKAAEILPQFTEDSSPLTWFEIKGGRVRSHIVNPKSFGHGIGVGDVNGDKRNDILTPKGWFEAPADPRSGEWIWRSEFDLQKVGFMHVLDVNGDGLNDIVTSMAHDYGVFWLEHLPDGRWDKHVIDESWSQAHALTVADLNGDGQLDLITGKRYMAHNGRDPGAREPLGLYWYEHRKGPDAKALIWIRHVIDYSTRTGTGMQIAVADIDRDGDPDIAVAGKSGLFLFGNLTKGKGGGK
jgi:FG-GAP-like repeat